MTAGTYDAKAIAEAVMRDEYVAPDMVRALAKALLAPSERGDSGVRWIPVADEIARGRVQEVAAMMPIYTLYRGQWYRLDGLKEPK